ncbi:MAG: spore coat protein CotJB [Clostridia bacterium]|nr:spore coat protein CotJB [Clostridia bacterium]
MNLNERDNLLRKIQAEDFALYETVLFLDGHPHDEAALAFYSAHRDTLEKLKREYTKKYGPLTIYDNGDSKCWHWIDKPWPWEKEAN